jgi:hypothetical protein
MTVFTTIEECSTHRRGSESERETCEMRENSEKVTSRFNVIAAVFLSYSSLKETLEKEESLIKMPS